jgi:hypothetical protein
MPLNAISHTLLYAIKSVEKLIVAQVVKTFPAFSGSLKILAVFTRDWTTISYTRRISSLGEFRKI